MRKPKASGLRDDQKALVLRYIPAVTVEEAESVLEQIAKRHDQMISGTGEQPTVVRCLRDIGVLSVGTVRMGKDWIWRATRVKRGER